VSSRIDFASLPAPAEGILVTLFISVADYQPGDTISIFLNLPGIGLGRAISRHVTPLRGSTDSLPIR
jgi:hypothetical protein